jgi:hypothetical protein
MHLRTVDYSNRLSHRDSREREPRVRRIVESDFFTNLGFDWK